MRFPLVWRTTLERQQAAFDLTLAEQRALIDRLQDKLETARADLAEAEARAVVGKPVKKESESVIRKRLAERGLQGEQLDQATREIVEQGLRTLGRLG